MMVTKLACLGVAGAAGTLARFWISEAVKRAFPSSMPWGTWAVNIIGCFLFGLFWTLAEERNLISPEFRFFALVGFLGAFTTFSTYVFESVSLLREEAVYVRLLNILGQNIFGVIAVVAGMAIARAAS